MAQTFDRMMSDTQEAKTVSNSIERWINRLHDELVECMQNRDAKRSGCDKFFKSYKHHDHVIETYTYNFYDEKSIKVVWQAAKNAVNKEQLSRLFGKNVWVTMQCDKTFGAGFRCDFSVRH